MNQHEIEDKFHGIRIGRGLGVDMYVLVIQFFDVVFYFRHDDMVIIVNIYGKYFFEEEIVRIFPKKWDFLRV